MKRSVTRALAAAGVIILCASLAGGLWLRERGGRTSDEASPAGEETVTAPAEPETALQLAKASGLPAVICYGDNSYEGRGDMQRAIERVEKEYADRVLVLYVNTEEEPDMARDAFLPALPVIVFVGAGGLAYVPAESTDQKYGFQLYLDPMTKKPLYTYHLGCLNRWALREILNDLLEAQ
ncbi:MAG: hypothetical protein IK083_06715 [Abditibacteriota bacterium]|nr:hypothetical protein [Abditibacteriota bacterium]